MMERWSRATQVESLEPDQDHTGTVTNQIDLEDAAVRAAVGVVPVRIAVFTVPASACTAPDQHAAQELWSVLRGEGLVRCNGREMPARAGQTFALPAGEEHQFIAFEQEAIVLSVWWGS